MDGWSKAQMYKDYRIILKETMKFCTIVKRAKKLKTKLLN